MNFVVRCTVAITLSLAVIAGLACTAPTWFAAVGLDFSDLAASGQAIRQEADRKQRLGQKSDQVLQNEESKNHILRELMAGRLPLRDATAQIMNLSDRSQVRLALDALALDGRTEEERQCRLVMFWARELTSDVPEQAAQLQERLESQLAAQFRQGGPTPRS